MAAQESFKQTTSLHLKNMVESDPCASFWLKAAINAASKRDCLDALNDAEMLLEYVREVAKENGIAI